MSVHDGKPRSKAKPRQTRYAPGLLLRCVRAGGGRWGTRRYERTGRCAALCLPVKLLSSDTAEPPQLPSALAEPFGCFSLPIPFWFRHRDDGWHKSHQTGGGSLFISSGCIVVCNVPAIVIHGSFPERTAMAKKGRRLIRWSKTDHAELKRHSRSKTPVVKVAKAMKRTERSIRQKAASLGFSIGHQR